MKNVLCVIAFLSVAHICQAQEHRRHLFSRDEWPLAIAATADNTITLAFLYDGRIKEANPLASWAQGQPTSMWLMGEAVIIGELWLWRQIEHQHPTFARRGRRVSTITRGLFVAHNASLMLTATGAYHVGRLSPTP